MSVINCEACSTLKDEAPSFVQNGVTERIAESLEKDTGFNPSLTILHDNCEDLNLANDCAIGRMSQEIAAYDSCNWKEYMSKLVPNMYELNKAIIAGDCGQWNQIHSMCAMWNTFMMQKYRTHGIMGDSFINHNGDTYEENYRALHSGGEIVNGIMALQEGAGWARCGIYYNRFEGLDCDGEKTLYEWVRPTIYASYFTSEPTYGQVIYRVPVTWAQQRWGWSDALIAKFTYSTTDFDDMRHPTTDRWDDLSTAWSGETYVKCCLAINVFDGYVNVRYMGKLAGAGNIANIPFATEDNNPVIVQSSL